VSIHDESIRDEVAEENGPQSSVTLDVPCRPEYLSLGRLVAGSLGGQQGWDEEAITDLKLVVSEVSSLFITSPDSPCLHAGEQDEPAPYGVLRLEFEVGPTDWTLIVRHPDLGLRLPDGAFADPHSERALGLTIVEALVDAVEQSDDQTEGTVFRVRKHLSPFEDAED
jgi:anti-sigma regulatory factor (Ser/Thr protein kinase)